MIPFPTFRFGYRISSLCLKIQNNTVIKLKTAFYNVHLDKYVSSLTIYSNLNPIFTESSLFKVSFRLFINMFSKNYSQNSILGASVLFYNASVNF